ncbi:MAG: hypothetical protein Kow00117_02390 [Phototrophicales bacterium]
MTTDFTPADEFIINNLETLKVIADPLRLNIVEYLAEPGTVKEVAEKIGKPPTKLYYHFNLLEKHGIIRMVDTRIVSGIVEKHYQATAHRYRLAHGLLSPTQVDQNLDVTISGVVGDIRNDVLDSIHAGVIDTSENAPAHKRLILAQSRAILTPELAEEFYQRLQELMEEYGFNKREPAIPEGNQHLYKMLLILHPSNRGHKVKTPEHD